MKVYQQPDYSIFKNGNYPASDHAGLEMDRNCRGILAIELSSRVIQYLCRFDGYAAEISDESKVD